MNQPPVTLESLSENEKEQLITIARKGVVRGAFMYLIPFFFFLWIVIYMNNYPSAFNLEHNADLRGWLNLILVLLIVIPIRLFVNTVMVYRKANNAWQKKVVRGKVEAVSENSLLLVGMKINFPIGYAEKIAVGEEVIASISTTGNFTFSIEKKEN
jgi:hypothetical protein